MSQADPCRRALTPLEEARLFARDAVRAARASWSTPSDADHAMLAVFAVLAVEALWPELLDEGAGGVRPRD
ncbi:hypothetical protein ACIQW5_25915 [Methylorubrum thiocyanatum]|uniref:hypothetical protein n=1 Tax=Methylorubrum TaxID=2282523 RepID=UPI0000382E13|nr:hypothetical protein [Methylorubrum populi]PZP68393.1 MAG: hypothetical protein DI590_16730 [Methylorubrum populi]